MNNRSRKREKPYPSRHAPYPAAKRRRPVPLDTDGGEDAANGSSVAETAPKMVLVIGVPMECSVLDLKSRFEIYGPISRTRMEPNGVAHITFRSNAAAQSALDAARDSDFPITLNSVPVQVMWASDPVPQWKEGVGRKDGLSSKLVRAEVPLRRHGRGNKLGSAIVNPRDENKTSDGVSVDKSNNMGDKVNQTGVIGKPSSEGSFRGREIVAYDDIL